MLIAVCCDRGAPGSTTTALALAAATPVDCVLVEADPYGGDLAVRCAPPNGGSAFPPAPTVLTLAAEARTSVFAEQAARRAHEFTSTTRIVPAHFSAEQAAGVMNWAPLARALRASSTRVVADLGRIHANSPSVPVAAAADVVVVVTRPELGAVLHLKDRLERLVPVLAKIRNAPPVVVPVVVTGRRTAKAVTSEVAQLLRSSSAEPVVADVGWIAVDPAGVARLEGGHVGGKDSRTALLRSATALNEAIDQLVPHKLGAAAGAPPEESASAFADLDSVGHRVDQTAVTATRDALSEGEAR